MTVNFTHPEYDKIKNKWKLVRSIVNNDAVEYIRVVDKDDTRRSEQYRQDAILTNFTRLTAAGLTGLVFRKPATIELPTELQYLLDDCTGYDFGLEQLSQQVTFDILQTGRCGLLVDAPTQVGGSALFKFYTAETIINWRYEEINGKYKLALVVLKEYEVIVDDDGFGMEFRDRYRALRLVDGIYYQELYNCDFELIEYIVPVDYYGNALGELPFSFIGSENNDAWMDSIPLYDLAILNLGHYKNSADVEETSFVSGQLMPVINVGESSAEDFKASNPNGIVVGSRSGVVVPAGGDFKFVQGQPNILPRELQKDKEAQAVSIGARFIAPAGAGRETAEGARIRMGSQNSSLYQLTKNISLAFEWALWWTALFVMENPTDSEFVLNDQFYEETADPQLIAQEIMLFDRGIMSSQEIRDNLKRDGVTLENKLIIVDPLAGVEDVPAE